MKKADYQRTAKLFYSATGIDITVYNPDGQPLITLTDDRAATKFYGSFPFKKLSNSLNSSGYNHYIAATKLEYLIIKLTTMAPKTGIIVAGPFITKTVSHDELNNILIANSLTVSESSQLEQFYQGLPILSPAKIGDIGTLLVNLFNHKLYQPNQTTITEKNASSLPNPITIINAQDKAQIERRYAAEQALMTAIASGDELAVKQQNSSINRITELFSNRIPNKPLRSTKNICFVYNTLCRIAAHQGGVHPVYLNAISEKYALLIERQNTVTGLQSLTTAMALAYCKLVATLSTNGYSPIIKRAIDYMLLNLGHHIALQQIATEVGTNPTYLSRKFKEAVGLTITDYINNRRVAEAKKYLVRKTPSITDIALMTGFNNVTYFIKVFKQLVGKTPLAYRNNSNRRES